MAEPTLLEKIAAIRDELELAGAQEYLMSDAPHLVTVEVRQALALRSAELRRK
jgi:hypothetical protein